MTREQHLDLLDQVLSRHVMREFDDRNRLHYCKPMARTDLRDAVKALRFIRKKKAQLQ